MIDYELDAWTHPKTGRVHFHPGCRAVFWYRDSMNPGVLVFTSGEMLDEVADEMKLCEWCLRMTKGDLLRGKLLRGEHDDGIQAAREEDRDQAELN